MKRLILAAALLSGLGFAAAAQADSSLTATLASPAPKDTTLIAGDAFWACDGTTCTVESDPGGVSLFLACRDLKSQLKIDVTQISSATQQLSADELAKCNK